MSNEKKKASEHTCSSWCSGRRYAACFVGPVLVVASSEVRPPGQPRPSDQRDAWRPGRASNPAIERQTQIRSASLLRLFIILIFGMRFCLLSAFDFSADVCGSKAVQKLNNSAVFNPRVLKENTISDLLDFFFFPLLAGILAAPSHINPAVKCLSECWTIDCRKPKRSRLSWMPFRRRKEATHRVVKAKYVNAFTLLRIQGWLSNLMRPFVPRKCWPFCNRQLSNVTIGLK